MLHFSWWLRLPLFIARPIKVVEAFYIKLYLFSVCYICCVLYVGGAYSEFGKSATMIGCNHHSAAKNVLTARKKIVT